MSRWVENFENHAFQKTWADVGVALSKIDLPKKSDTTLRKEVARLKKIEEYISSNLKKIDPELVPLAVWDTFNSSSNQALEQIKSFSQNSNVGHLSNGNNNLDGILQSISPYIIQGKGTAQAAVSAFKQYSKEIDAHLTSFDEEARITLEALQETADSIKLLAQPAEKSANNIQKLETEFLVGDEENDSLQTKLQTLKDEIIEWHSKIETFNAELNIGNDEQASTHDQISAAKSLILDSSYEIIERLDATKTSVAKLDKFHEKIFGINIGDDETQGGLENEIISRKVQLDKYEDLQHEKYKAIENEIKSLLPDATNAGLASAYKELSDDFSTATKRYSRLFYSSLVGLFVVGMFTITNEISLWPFNISFVQLIDYTELAKNILFKLPITIPLVWMSIFSSQRRGENNRLFQEYNHKFAMAKSYQSFKMQADKLGENGNSELLNKLLESTIETVSYNAASTLDKKQEENVPLFGKIDPKELLKSLFASSKEK